MALMAQKPLAGGSGGGSSTSYYNTLKNSAGTNQTQRGYLQLGSGFLVTDDSGNDASVVAPDTTILGTIAAIQASSYTHGTDSGSTDTWAASPSNCSIAVDGTLVSVKLNTANTGPATLNWCSQGDKKVFKMGDQELATGDTEAGMIGSFKYSSTADGGVGAWQMQSQLAQAPTTTPAKRTFGVVLVGSGSAPATGIHGDVTIPYACTITRVSLLADQTGSIVVDLWKDTYANYPPTDADSITASAPPTLSSAVKGEDVTLTGWTTAVAAGDIIRFNVDSAATLTRATLTVECQP